MSASVKYSMDLRNKLQGLLDRDYDSLLGYARRLLGRGDGSEDLVQDALLKVLDQADPTMPVRNLSAYVYRTIRNRAIDLFRSRRPALSLDGGQEGNTVTLHDLLKDFRYTAHSAAEAGELKQLVLQAMDRLGDEERAVVIATEFEGKPYRELAVSWDIPAGTLMARKKRALEKIRRHLEKHGPELRHQ